jgi:hypothetical protein
MLSHRCVEDGVENFWSFLNLQVRPHKFGGAKGTRIPDLTRVYAGQALFCLAMPCDILRAVVDVCGWVLKIFNTPATKGWQSL